MKTLLVTLATAFAASALLAADVPQKKDNWSEKLDRIIRDSLPVCEDAKVTRSALDHKMPENMTASLVRVESKRASCETQLLSVTSRQGGFYIGTPWFLDGYEGTIEEKLTRFGWEQMQTTLTPVVDRTPTRDGLFKVKVFQSTEAGKIPLEAEVDPEGTVVFLGHFRTLNDDVRSQRLKAFESYLGHMPAAGAAKPEVTVIEFSDFECPSCQRAAKYLEPILAKHGERVRYIRYDLPLVSAHPWAFGAAVAGRAIWRQKPEAFWEFKKQVYENQDKLNAFVLDDFARNFAKDHDLDIAKYDADVASADIRNEIIGGVGTAFSNDIRATPSYLVNGQLVDAGENGKSLEAYVASLLKP
jgi:protein-disulfide isomerase